MTIPDVRLRLARAYVNADWIDKTADVRGDGSDGITIVRGVPEERQTADPATCDFTLENLDGKYTPRNPRSAYYDILGQNLPVRVRTKEGSATTLPSVRATEHTDTGNDTTITVTTPTNAEGDILIVVHAYGSAAQFTPTIDRSGGTGWERLVFWEEPEAYTAGGTAPYKNVVIWWKRVTAVAEDATLTLRQAGTYHGRVVAMAIQDSGGFIPMIDAGKTTNVSVNSNIGILPMRGLQLYTAVKWGNVTIAQEGASYTTVASIAGAADQPTVCVLSGDENDDEVWTDPDYAMTNAYYIFTEDPFNFTAGIDIMAANHPRNKFWGEVSAWPQTWTSEGADATVEVNAGGILRRYAKDPATSPFERTAGGRTRHPMPSFGTTDEVAFWPLSGDLSSMGAGKTGRVLNRAAVEYGRELSPGGEGAKVVTSSAVTGIALPFPPFGDTYDTYEYRGVGFTFRLDPDTTVANHVTVRGSMWQLGGEDFSIAVAATATTITVTVTKIRQDGGASVTVGTAVVDRTPDDYYRVLFEWGIHGYVYWITVNGEARATGTWTTTGGASGSSEDILVWADVPVGQFQAYRNIWSAMFLPEWYNLWPATCGYIGETAAERIHRLCREERIGPEVFGEKAENRNRLGAQPTGNLVDVLMDAAKADGGILTESTRRLGITYRPRTDLYWSNVVELDYTDGTIQPSLEPVEDDQTILNQVTYTADGTSYSLTETDGARGTLRAGVYAKTGDISTFHRTMLAQRAAWDVYLGTLDESRYRDITVNTRAIEAKDLGVPGAYTTLAQSLRDLVIGDRIKLTNLPIWIPPGPAHLTIVGITETLTNLDHVITFHTRPGSPYMPGIVGDSAAGAVDVKGQRVDASASTVGTTVDADDTTLSVVTSLASRLAAPWTVDADDMDADLNGGGLYIDVGGEKMQVTAIAADSSTIAHDADTESATFTTTTPHAYNHTPVGTPKAVLVFISHGTPETDVITSVTYGGVTMTRVGTTSDTAGEPGRVYVYALTAGIPAGVQAVSIVHSGSATVKYTACVTVTASGTLAVREVKRLFEDQANPQTTFTTIGATALHYSILYSGQDAMASVAPLANMTAICDNDFGAFVTSIDRETASSQADSTIGYTVAAEDVAFLAVELVNTTATQSFTVVRNIDDYAAAHVVGDEVHVAYPIRVGL